MGGTGAVRARVDGTGAPRTRPTEPRSPPYPAATGRGVTTRAARARTEQALRPPGVACVHRPRLGRRGRRRPGPPRLHRPRPGAPPKALPWLGPAMIGCSGEGFARLGPGAIGRCGEGFALAGAGDDRVLWRTLCPAGAGDDRAPRRMPCVGRDRRRPGARRTPRPGRTGHDRAPRPTPRPGRDRRIGTRRKTRRRAGGPAAEAGRVSLPGQRLLRPDDLARGRVAGAPAFGELGDQEQAAPALVRHGRVPQVR